MAKGARKGSAGNPGPRMGPRSLDKQKPTGIPDSRRAAQEAERAAERRSYSLSAREGWETRRRIQAIRKKHGFTN